MKAHTDENMNAGDIVSVKGFSGIACQVVGTPPEWNPDIVEAWWCAGCQASVADPDAFESQPCAECGASGFLTSQVETGEGEWLQPSFEDSDRVIVVMVGDDKRHTVDKDNCTPIEREDYCGECGQIGCSHDGYDRSEA